MTAADLAAYAILTVAFVLTYFVVKESDELQCFLVIVACFVVGGIMWFAVEWAFCHVAGTL
jgi:hypothetical protein